MDVSCFNNTFIWTILHHSDMTEIVKLHRSATHGKGGLPPCFSRFDEGFEKVGTSYEESCALLHNVHVMSIIGHVKHVCRRISVSNIGLFYLVGLRL